MPLIAGEPWVRSVGALWFVSYTVEGLDGFNITINVIKRVTICILGGLIDFMLIHSASFCSRTCIVGFCSELSIKLGSSGQKEIGVLLVGQVHTGLGLVLVGLGFNCT